MEKTITTKIYKFISSSNIKKDGSEMKDKFGKPSYMTKIEILGKDGFPQELTGFLQSPCPWKDGDEVEIVIYEGKEFQGKKQWNFKLPRKEDKIAKVQEEILSKLTKIDLQLAELVMHKRVQTGEEKLKVSIEVPEMDETNNASDF
jgi:hypothetical protein